MHIATWVCISAYAQANKLKDAAFLAIDKSTGEIVLTPVHSMEFINAEARIKHLKGMVISDTVPDLCYDPVPDGKSGNYKLKKIKMLGTRRGKEYQNVCLIWQKILSIFGQKHRWCQL